MKKFRFNLQKVLDYRETIEEKLLAELAELRTQHHRESDKLTEITKAGERCREELKKHLSQGNLDDIKHGYWYMNELARQAKSQEMVIRRIAELRDKKLDEVLEASKDRKVLEKLRDYKLLEHKHEALADEQKFLDDIASVRHSRNTLANPSGGGQK